MDLVKKLALLFRQQTHIKDWDNSLVKQEIQSFSLSVFCVELRNMLPRLTFFISFSSMIFFVHMASVKVIKTADWIPPGVEDRGRVEIVGAQLNNYADLTLCVRLQTFQFGFSQYNYQGIIFAKPLRILGSYSTIIRKPFI